MAVRTPVVHNDDGFDVIGDIHGEFDALVQLLTVMGYSEIDGTWRHPTRHAIFIGDLVDRGEQQVAVIRLVQAMVAARTASIVMGNHEYNALAWHTPMPGTDDFCRSHDEVHTRQHRHFLEQVDEGSPLHHEFIEWFSTIPLWLEARVGEHRLRCVHACWHEPSMQVLERVLRPDCTIDADGIVATSIRDTPEQVALEIVLKGPEIDLMGHTYRDKDGHVRDRARVRWWEHRADTLRSLAVVPKNATAANGEPLQELPSTLAANEYAYSDQVPVVVGHYWNLPPLEPFSDHVACVDYSIAGKDDAKGPLAAYRWNGEAKLDTTRYVRHDD